MKAYKGFNKDMTCRGFQYEVGKEYETDKAELCESGFHACEAPLRVWDFYPPINGNRFCEVEQSGDVKREEAGGKSVSTKLKVCAEIDIPGLAEAQIKWVKKLILKAEGEQVGDCATLAGGYRAMLAGGDCATLAGGDCATLAGGDYAKLAGGKSSICAGGKNSKAKGGMHSVLLLTSWEWRENENIPVCVKAIVIDGKKYKPNTWYTLCGGEVVEADGKEG